MGEHSFILGEFIILHGTKTFFIQGIQKNACKIHPKIKNMYAKYIHSLSLLIQNKKSQDIETVILVPVVKIR